MLPRHWRRNRGRLVTVTLRDGGSLTGRITDSDEVAATLLAGTTVHDVPFDSVRRATVQIEFNRSDDSLDHGKES